MRGGEVKSSRGKGPQEKETQKGRNEEEREGATVVRGRTEEEGRSYLGDGQLNVSPYEVFARNLSE